MVKRGLQKSKDALCLASLIPVYIGGFFLLSVNHYHSVYTQAAAFSLSGSRCL